MRFSTKVIYLIIIFFIFSYQKPIDLLALTYSKKIYNAVIEIQHKNNDDIYYLKSYVKEARIYYHLSLYKSGHLVYKKNFELPVLRYYQIIKRMDNLFFDGTFTAMYPDGGNNQFNKTGENHTIDDDLMTNHDIKKKSSFLFIKAFVKNTNRKVKIFLTKKYSRKFGKLISMIETYSIPRKFK